MVSPPKKSWFYQSEGLASFFGLCSMPSDVLEILLYTPQHKERREISSVGSENYAQFQLVFPQSKLDLEGLDVVASLSNELVFTFWPK